MEGRSFTPGSGLRSAGAGVAASSSPPPQRQALTGWAMFFRESSPASLNGAATLPLIWACTASDTRIPPLGAAASSRAATLTPSPKMSPASITTSPMLMPMRRQIDAHVGPRGGKVERNLTADAATRAGNQHGLAFEFGHPIFLRVLSDHKRISACTLTGVGAKPMGMAADRWTSTAVWQALHRQPAAPHMTTTDEVPSAPFCAVRLAAGAVHFPDAMDWLGGFERSLAWAWLRRQ